MFVEIVDIDLQKTIMKWILCETYVKMFYYSAAVWSSQIKFPREISPTTLLNGNVPKQFGHLMVLTIINEMFYSFKLKEQTIMFTF